VYFNGTTLTGNVAGFWKGVEHYDVDYKVFDVTPSANTSASVSSP